MSRAWMPLYIGDYVADTQHLTTVQHGAYMLLIMHYWQHGPLPLDDATLRRITKLDDQGWRRNRQAVLAFFHEGSWPADSLHGMKASAKQLLSKCLRHKRLDDEREKAEIIRTKRQIAGQIGGRWPRGKANGYDHNHQANAKRMGTQSQSHIESYLPSSEPRAVEKLQEGSREGSKGRASPSLAEIVQRKGWVS